MGKRIVLGLVSILVVAAAAGCSSGDAGTETVRDARGALVAEGRATPDGFESRIVDGNKELARLTVDRATRRGVFSAKALGAVLTVPFPANAELDAHATNLIALATWEQNESVDPTARRWMPFCCAYIGYGGNDEWDDYACTWTTDCGSWAAEVAERRRRRSGEE